MHNEIALTGTPAQVVWAEQIRTAVAEEFDRVAKLLRARMSRQLRQNQAETGQLLVILEQKRAETLANTRAVYFIRDWRELSDQVRRIVTADPRFEAIRREKAVRRHNEARN